MKKRIAPKRYQRLTFIWLALISICFAVIPAAQACNSEEGATIEHLDIATDLCAAVPGQNGEKQSWKLAVVSKRFACWREDMGKIVMQFLAEDMALPRETCDEQWTSHMNTCRAMDFDADASARACRLAFKIVQHLPEDDPRYAETLSWLITAVQDGEEKERLMRLHLDVLVNHHPGNKIEIIGAIGMFGHVYAKRQDWKSAEIWYRKALAYGTEHLGEENIEVAAQRFFVGRALLEQKRHIEAERLILASLKVAAKKLGDSVQGSFARTHQRVCARFLVRLYEEQEQSEQAERFRPLSVRSAPLTNSASDTSGAGIDEDNHQFWLYEIV